VCSCVIVVFDLFLFLSVLLVLLHFMRNRLNINDKLQGSVATYLKCGGVVNNIIKKGLLLNL